MGGWLCPHLLLSNHFSLRYHVGSPQCAENPVTRELRSLFRMIANMVDYSSMVLIHPNFRRPIGCQRVYRCDLRGDSGSALFTVLPLSPFVWSAS